MKTKTFDDRFDDGDDISEALDLRKRAVPARKFGA